jgi:hypothetical protein
MKKLILMVALSNVATVAIAADVGGVIDGGAYVAALAQVAELRAALNHEASQTLAALGGDNVMDRPVLLRKVQRDIRGLAAVERARSALGI